MPFLVTPATICHAWLTSVVLAVAAFDGAVAHVEGLAVDLMIDRELVGIEGARRRQDHVRCAGGGGGRENLIRQRHGLDDETRLLLRIEAGQERRPVVVDHVVCGPEQVQLLRVRQRLDTRIGGRVEATARSDDNRGRAIREAGVADGTRSRRCPTMNVTRKCLSRRGIEIDLRQVVGFRKFRSALKQWLCSRVVERDERVVLVLRPGRRSPTFPITWYWFPFSPLLLRVGVPA